MKQSQTYWKRLVVVFFMGWLLMYANRTVLTPLMSILEVSWELNKTQLGLINSLFFLLYSAAQVPAGLLADRVGRKLVLVPGYLLHAVGAAFSGLATGYPFFLGSRMLTGLSQGTYFATQYAIISAEVPVRFRAVASAITMSGSALGIAAGTMLASLMVYQAGLPWRVPFLFLSALTMLLAVLMMRLIRSDAAWVATAKRTTAPKAFRPSASLIKLFLTGSLTMYGFYVIVTWLPYYLQNTRGIEGSTAGIISTIMPLATVPSAILVGMYADRTGKRSSLMSWLIPLGAVALTLVILSPGRVWLYLALGLYGLSGKLVIDPLLIALVAEQADSASYGKAFALLNFAGTVSMVLAPTITGVIVDVTGRFDSGFLLAAVLQLSAWLILLSMRTEMQASRPS